MDQGSYRRSQLVPAKKSSRGVSKLRKWTHVPHVNDLASLGARCSEIGEGVGRDRCSRVVVEATSSGETASAATLSVASAEAATTPEAAATPEATTEASSATEASSTTKAHSGVREAVGTDLKDTALPIVSIELLDSVSSIVGCLEYHDTGSLGSPVRPQVDIGADDTASAGCVCVSVSLPTSKGNRDLQRESFDRTCLPEQILQILPSNSVGKL